MKKAKELLIMTICMLLLACFPVSSVGAEESQAEETIVPQESQTEELIVRKMFPMRDMKKLVMISSLEENTLRWGFQKVVRLERKVVNRFPSYWTSKFRIYSGF